MKYLVVDDHALIRDALRSVLRELDTQSQVLEAATGAAAEQQWRHEDDIDLVLLDLHLPDADGMDLLVAIGRERPGTAVVMLSGDVDQERIRQALAQGAQGYIPKAESRDVLVRALGLVLAGGVYVPPAALPELARSPNSERPRPADKADPHSAASTPKALELTERQLEVLALLMEGKNNKMIGRALDLAEPTVKSHVSAILRALGVGSRTEAVLAVSRLGWVPARPGQP
jgi:DNA-binding NarL/FixJ family response regulator